MAALGAPPFYHHDRPRGPQRQCAGRYQPVLVNLFSALTHYHLLGPAQEKHQLFLIWQLRPLLWAMCKSLLAMDMNFLMEPAWDLMASRLMIQQKF